MKILIIITLNLPYHVAADELKNLVCVEFTVKDITCKAKDKQLIFILETFSINVKVKQCHFLKQ